VQRGNIQTGRRLHHPNPPDRQVGSNAEECHLLVARFLFHCTLSPILPQVISLMKREEDVHGLCSTPPRVTGTCTAYRNSTVHQLFQSTLVKPELKDTKIRPESPRGPLVTNVLMATLQTVATDCMLSMTFASTQPSGNLVRESPEQLVSPWAVLKTHAQVSQPSQRIAV
jgi:hypothetical protein